MPRLTRPDIERVQELRQPHIDISFEPDHRGHRPNGSGKSNISDGVRWVLASKVTRWLRSKKTEDIFAVGNGRAPGGFAEVTVTFDSTGWLPIE
ncbi:MAG: hypothetical protein R2855_09730 [Thermomicrobiales bacterium]